MFNHEGEDAEEEQINAEKFEELYSGVEFKDPKKTLRGYYEREGNRLKSVVHVLCNFKKTLSLKIITGYCIAI